MILKKELLWFITILLLVILLGCKNAELSEGNHAGNAHLLSRPESLTPGDYRFEIYHDGLVRFYLLHVPPSYTGEPASLLLALHGGGGSAQRMMEEYDLVSKADEEGFIVAFPNGASRFKDGRLATWNAGTCCGHAIESESDDVGYIQKVISDIKAMTDVEKVYAAGFSNGGMMTYRLACEIPDFFVATASVAGTDNTQECDSSEPSPIMHIHTLDDPCLPFEGGEGGCALTEDYTFTSVPETFSLWQDRNFCNENKCGRSNMIGGYCDLCTACDKGGGPVKLCVLEEGGHSWLTNPPNVISATDEIWNFFQQLP
ncbi:MAG: poly(3-hydroxybutyrate) depolymerase [Nanoarchaeota archaeon]|nr:poly(3-hydroxybutyrate) depolymerase [Nanoarchaeota archaeon]